MGSSISAQRDRRSATGPARTATFTTSPGAPPRPNTLRKLHPTHRTRLGNPDLQTTSEQPTVTSTPVAHLPNTDGRPSTSTGALSSGRFLRPVTATDLPSTVRNFRPFTSAGESSTQRFHGTVQNLRETFTPMAARGTSALPPRFIDSEFPEEQHGPAVDVVTCLGCATRFSLGHLQMERFGGAFYCSLCKSDVAAAARCSECGRPFESGNNEDVDSPGGGIGPQGSEEYRHSRARFEDYRRKQLAGSWGEHSSSRSSSNAHMTYDADGSERGNFAGRVDEEPNWERLRRPSGRRFSGFSQRVGERLSITLRSQDGEPSVGR